MYLFRIRTFVKKNTGTESACSHVATSIETLRYSDFSYSIPTCGDRLARYSQTSSDCILMCDSVICSSLFQTNPRFLVRSTRHNLTEGPDSDFPKVRIRTSGGPDPDFWRFRIRIFRTVLSDGSNQPLLFHA
jgi:hypothetical protein